MTRRPIDLDIPSLAGRRAVVTGGSDGIGRRIATRLAAAGADVVLPVRNAAKGDAAVASIRKVAPDARIRTAPLDLASLDSVAAFGEAMRGQGEPIHLLINNAGVMTPPNRQTTADGFEVQWGTNHLAHVALVAQLLPLLRAGRARVTSQISVAAARGGIDWDDLDSQRGYDGMRAYRQSKIAFGLFGLELARRSAAHGWGVTSNLSHPGVAPTSLLAARTELGRADDTLAVRVIRWASARHLIVGTPETAALPALLAATATTSRSGALYSPGGPGHLGGAPSEQTLYRPLQSEADATRIWNVSARLVGAEFPG